MHTIVPEKYAFNLNSGTSIRSLTQLANHMPKMTAQDFHHHTQQGRNDFCKWIEDVFQEHELANKLRTCNSREQFQTVLYNHIIQQRKADGATKNALSDIIQKVAHPQEEKPPVVPSSVDQKQQSETASPPLNEKPVPPPVSDRPEGTPPPTEHNQEEQEIIDNPEKFIEFHNKEAEEKDVVADRFDAINQRFQEALHPEQDQKIADRIEKLEEAFRDLRRKISEARREGKDPLIADLILRPLPAKLAYAKVTEQEKDFVQVDLILKEAERELQEALTKKEVDIRKEVEALVGGKS